MSDIQPASFVIEADGGSRFGHKFLLSVNGIVLTQDIGCPVVGMLYGFCDQGNQVVAQVLQSVSYFCRVGTRFVVVQQGVVQAIGRAGRSGFLAF